MAAKTSTRLVAVVLIVLVISSGIHSGARPRYRVRSKRVAPGLTFKRIFDREGPNRIRVLAVDPSKRFTLDVALGTEQLPGHEPTSSMARRHDAIAAVNGDFTLRPTVAGSGRPVNTFIEDAELHASSLIWGRNFSITRDETIVRTDHSALRTWMTQASGEEWQFDRVNPLEHDREGYTMYTPSGGRLFRPPPDSCAARFAPVTAFQWNADRNGVSREFVVEDVICRRRRVNRGSRYVISAPRSTLEAFTLRNSLAPGETVRFGWAMNRPGVLDTIGGNPDLLQDGRVVVDRCTGSYFCYRNPRTGVGVRKDGTILLVTVDGRSRSSVGMTLREFARLFQYLNATSALNMDGGGSTTMVLRNRIVNVPSDGRERPVGTALLVLPGRDQEEIEPVPSEAPSTTRTRSMLDPDIVAMRDGLQSYGDLACRGLHDPGSTGGMLDALDKGLLYPADALPRQLRWAVRVFRGGVPCE